MILVKADEKETDKVAMTCVKTYWTNETGAITADKVLLWPTMIAMALAVAITLKDNAEFQALKLSYSMNGLELLSITGFADGMGDWLQLGQHNKTEVVTDNRMSNKDGAEYLRLKEGTTVYTGTDFIAGETYQISFKADAVYYGEKTQEFSVSVGGVELDRMIFVGNHDGPRDLTYTFVAGDDPGSNEVALTNHDFGYGVGIDNLIVSRVVK